MVEVISRNISFKKMHSTLGVKYMNRRGISWSWNLDEKNKYLS